MPDFIDVFAVHPSLGLFGALIALAYVGQRDTKWLIPLTVSGGYQGEEGNCHMSGATDNPTAVAPFIFASLRHSVHYRLFFGFSAQRIEQRELIGMLARFFQMPREFGLAGDIQLVLFQVSQNLA